MIRNVRLFSNILKNCVRTEITQIAISERFHSFTKVNFKKQITSQSKIYSTRNSPIRKRHSNSEAEGKRRLPHLLYIQHPWRYLKTKLQFLRLKLFWDRSFKETDFIFGTKQAVAYITDLIRNQEGMEIGNLTTPLGFQQITRDMILSKEDPRLNLVQFRQDDIKKAIPIRVIFLKRAGRKHCIVDMFFVGMRNLDDFGTTDDAVKMRQFLRKWESMHENREGRTREEEEYIRRAREALSKAVFAEIFMRFYREYTSQVQPDWFVSFYKIVSFDILAFE